ncbi:MAG: CPBP family intramembrane metalloprotease [Oscillospiraceae bacterium]|nr:CPBP family intramembrane metalloprotease [Oscillospiraceae bacterium]
MSEPAKARRFSKTMALIVYIVVFYGLWTAWEFLIKDMISASVNNEYVSQFIKSGVIKNLFWVLPAALLVKRFDGEVYVGIREMFSTKVKVWRYLPILLLFTVYLLGGVILQKGRITVSETFKLSDIIIVLFVGITEEMVFRGWLLNALIGKNSNNSRKWFAVTANSVMFLLIHFPVWIHSGVFIEEFRSFGFLSILILSGIFGWTFIKSRNIWIPVALHMYWDLLMFVFF